LLCSSPIEETFAAQNQGTLFASSFGLQTLQDLVPVDYFPAIFTFFRGDLHHLQDGL